MRIMFYYFYESCRRIFFNICPSLIQNSLRKNYISRKNVKIVYDYDFQKNLVLFICGLWLLFSTNFLKDLEDQQNFT